MPTLSRDREEDVPECSQRKISRIFWGKIRYLGNGIQERRPLAGMGLWDGQSEIWESSKKSKYWNQLFLWTVLDLCYTVLSLSAYHCYKLTLNGPEIPDHPAQIPDHLEGHKGKAASSLLILWMVFKSQTTQPKYQTVLDHDHLDGPGRQSEIWGCTGQSITFTSFFMALKFLNFSHFKTVCMSDLYDFFLIKGYTFCWELLTINLDEVSSIFQFF